MSPIIAKIKKNSKQIKEAFKNKLDELQPVVTPKQNELSATEKHDIAAITCASSFKLAQLIWNIAIVTLPIDLLSYYLSNDLFFLISQLPAFYPLAFACLGLCIVFAFKVPLIKFLKDTQKLYSQKLSGDRLLLVALVVCLLLGLAIEILQVSSRGVIAILVQMLIYGAALHSIFFGQKKIKSADLYTTKLKRDYFIVGSLPIICARLMSPFLIISIAPLLAEHSLSYLAVITLLCLILLMEFKPKKEDFINSCPRCAMFIPASLFKVNICQNCETRVAIAN